MRAPTVINLIFPVLILMLLQHSASGQEWRVYDFRFVRDISPWLTSGNYAGLGTLPTDRIAAAEVFFNKSDGGLAGIEESDDSWQAGAYQLSGFPTGLPSAASFHTPISGGRTWADRC